MSIQLLNDDSKFYKYEKLRNENVLFYGSVLFSSKISLISIEQLRHSRLNSIIEKIAPLYSRT